jgi:tRNA threonylcarbamoyladenosine biosynthesis protein TsaE
VDLGAGKTTLVQGVAQGWGSLDAVSSPTYILVNIYRRPDSCSLFHLDTYRIETISEAEELDLDDMLVQGPLLIEWPERLMPILPEDHLWVKLNYQDDEQRSMLFSPHGERYLELMDEFRQSVFGVI